MSVTVDCNTCVIIPNWNGIDHLSECLDSLYNQTLKTYIILVDNGSIDGSIELVQNKYPEVKIIKNTNNKGFAEAVNQGFTFAIDNKVLFAATFNNDAIADKYWLEKLFNHLDKNRTIGAATCKLLSNDGKSIDSTGDFYSVWGLPFPRGRGDKNINKFDNETDIFSASGGASLFRIEMLKEIGLFDNDYFAYYEDVDLGFRAQLAGWKIVYVPSAIAYHYIGATSTKVKGFAVYQTMKNLPLLYFKNIPRKYLFKVGWRLFIVYSLFYLRAITRGYGISASKGSYRSFKLIIDKKSMRKKIQQSKKVSDKYIWERIVHDLPQNATLIRSIRSRWWKLLNKSQ